MTAAYYLSCHKHNDVVVVERLEKPFMGTSHKNGSWMVVNYSYSWINVPWYPYVYRALFDGYNFFSKIYLSTFFQDMNTFLCFLKFGFRWLFFQPTPQQYGQITQTFQVNSWKRLHRIIEDEKLELGKDLIYTDGSQCLILQKGKPDFQKYIHGKEIWDFHPKYSKVDIINCEKDKERWEKEVVGKFGKLVPGVKIFTDALYRTLNICDVEMLGDCLTKALRKRSNVLMLCNTEVNGYDIDKSTGMVKAVKTTSKEHPSIDVDVVVMSNSPAAPYHLYEHFNTVLPSIQARGYAFD